ncbi:unnamed protein product [Choristocarpus tenellus]
MWMCCLVASSVVHQCTRVFKVCKEYYKVFILLMLLQCFKLEVVHDTVAINVEEKMCIGVSASGKGLEGNLLDLWIGCISVYLGFMSSNVTEMAVLT